MDERAAIRPGLPHPKPSVSYWQDPPSSLARHRTTDSIPSEVDTVIVGSGITGASAAYHLLTRQPQSSVLLLEARTATSGATGRNGGHTKAASYRSFLANLSAHGRDEAVRVARLERTTVLALRALAAEHHIDCDISANETLDVFFEQGQWQAALQATAIMNEICQGQDVETYEVISNPEEAKRLSQCPAAIACIKYHAGSVSAYKLGLGILNLALGKGLNLQTETAVQSLKQLAGGGWSVQTPRGNVNARQVILATNGYTPHLVPEFQGVIMPLRGHCTAQRPGDGLQKPAYPGSATFYYASGYEYMVRRPLGSVGEGDIVIGGGRTASLPDDGVTEFGETNDQAVLEPVIDYLERCTEHFWGANWGQDAAEGRMIKAWTGVMGCSADGAPYIGEMPGKKGLWIAASFNGHGMVSCFRCAEAVVAMVLGKDDEIRDWFPESFRLTSDRLKKQFQGRKGEKPPPEAMAVRDDIPTNVPQAAL